MKSTHTGVSDGPGVSAVPRQQSDHSSLERELGSPGQEHHPIVIALVLQEAIRRTVPRADSPTDPDTGALLKNGRGLFGEAGAMGSGFL